MGRGSGSEGQAGAGVAGPDPEGEEEAEGGGGRKAVGEGIEAVGVGGARAVVTEAAAAVSEAMGVLGGDAVAVGRLMVMVLVEGGGAGSGCCRRTAVVVNRPMSPAAVGRRGDCRMDDPAHNAWLRKSCALAARSPQCGVRLTPTRDALGVTCSERPADMITPSAEHRPRSCALLALFHSFVYWLG